MKVSLITLKFRHAYRKCENCYEIIKQEEMKRDFEQRMDELLLVYSNLFDISVNEAKLILGKKVKNNG